MTDGTKRTPGLMRVADIHANGFYGNNGGVSIVTDDKPICTVDCQTDFKRGQGHLAQCEERDANAAFIVRACNAHADMVEALRRADRALKNLSMAPTAQARVKIHAALSKATAP